MGFYTRNNHTSWQRYLLKEIYCNIIFCLMAEHQTGKGYRNDQRDSEICYKDLEMRTAQQMVVQVGTMSL